MAGEMGPFVPKFVAVPDDDVVIVAEALGECDEETGGMLDAAEEVE